MSQREATKALKMAVEKVLELLELYGITRSVRTWDSNARAVLYQAKALLEQVDEELKEELEESPGIVLTAGEKSMTEARRRRQELQKFMEREEWPKKR